MDGHDRRAEGVLKLLDQMKQTTGRAFSPGGVTQNIVLETPEFRRVRDLERRDWAAKDIDELVEVLTSEYKTPRGTQVLKPAQAAGLRELYDCGGLFAPIRVGGGKTLISLLAGTVVDAKRALLLVPAQLIEKTRREAYEYAKQWRIRPLTIESYEKLSRDREGAILGGLRPDLIIADEAHKLKNTGAGCTKRLSRYLQAMKREGTPVRFVAMSGSITTRSLREYWHLIRWALGVGAPLPSDMDEFVQWAYALDERVSPESRWQPGALVRLSPGVEPTPAELAAMSGVERAQSVLLTARRAYRERLVASPGVITTKDDIPPMSLTLRAVQLEAPPVIRDALTEMRATYCTPDGHPFEMPMELWRHARELQCGYYGVWDPRAPEDWLRARTDLSRFIRETLKYSRKFATPGDLIVAVKAGEYDEGGAAVWAAWQAVQHTFKPNPVPVWVDDTTLQYAANWLNTGDPNAKLCWTEHRAVGPKLSAMTGVPYFGAEGLDSRGNDIDTHVGPAIVSVRACSTGRNLQAWNANLYMTPMTKNAWWEQSLGRTHRDGQLADEVTAEVLLMCRESYSSMVYAIREGEYAMQTFGQPQKLIYATRDFGQIDAVIARRDDELWRDELEGV